jgi:hypothetical protein
METPEGVITERLLVKFSQADARAIAKAALEALDGAGYLILPSVDIEVR